MKYIKSLSCMLLIASGCSYAQTQVKAVTPLVPVTSEVKQILPNGSINTPSATGGASYDDNVVTGLDEYNTRKKKLQEKTEQMRIDNQKEAEESYRRKVYAANLAAAKEREKAKMSAISSKPGATPSNNSNQEYFDRQTKIMSGN